MTQSNFVGGKMGRKQESKRYRTSYTEENLQRAFWLVRKKNTPIRKAAWRCGVPVQTLRDRLSKGQNYSVPNQGAPTLFTREEERKLVEHIMKLAECGYPLSRREVIALATESSELLGTRPSNGKKLSKRWFERFMKRWPQLKLGKAQKLSMKRAKATSKETVEKYFKELDIIMTKYNLHNKPQLIFNVDETGFQTEHDPTKVVGGRNQRLNSITTERGAITTVLACGNAVGNSLPPYFVFKGKRDDPRLMNGCIPGSKYTMSDSGWSNGAIFKQFLEEHFIPLLPQRQKDEHALLLYDGHSSHISLPLIDLAKRHNIILFVLPPHTSHALQPLDVGTFRPVKCHYANECQREMRSRPGEVITRYDVCRLVCKSFLKAVTPRNLVNSFRATGVFPLNPSAVDQNHFKPSKNLARRTSSQTRKLQDGQKKFDNYLSSKLPTPRENISEKPQRKMGYRPAGVAITENSIILKLKKVYEESKQKTDKIINNLKRKTSQISVQEEAGPSKKLKPPTINQQHSSINQQAEESSGEEEDKCCICGKFSPDKLKDLGYLKIVDWAQCDHCDHWMHLDFCFKMTVTDAKKSTVKCIHCDRLEE